MLELRHVYVHFEGKYVLCEVNFHLHAGRIKCIGGESGSGKSTLLKAVMGFVPVRKDGEIYIDRQLLTAQTVNELRKKIAYVPQELYLPAETVEEMVHMPFTLIKNNRKHMPKRNELLAEWERLGLSEDLLRKRPNEISGGQRQRMMLATAGLLDKPLLLVDEPTSALDAETSYRVWQYFHHLANYRGTAILIATHDPQLLSLPDTYILPAHRR